jgi:lipoprotein-anchoring transpeptidase ErfK/SrfK
MSVNRSDTDASWIHISIGAQVLELVKDERCLARWPVSTGRAGPGERNGSGGTPRGWHVIRARIGAGMPSGTVFRGRRPSGEIYTPELRSRYPERDWILTRILWLSGLEPGRNRLGDVDTMRRYIYIHGGPDDAPVGVPGSRGCVRMRNADVITLFERAPAGTRVLIEE